MPDERPFFHYFFRTAAISLLACALTSCALRSGVVEESATPYKTPSAGQYVIAAPVPPPIDNNDKRPPSDDSGVSAERLFYSAVNENRSGSKKALATLSEIRQRHPGTVWAVRASFLLGVHALNDAEGKAGNALDLFKEAAPLTDIEDYITFYTAMALMRGNRPGEALASYDSILTLFPDTALKPEILLQRSGALMDMGRFPEAKDGFLNFLSAYPKHALVPEALLGAAQASIALGDMAGALKSVRGILASYPLHPASGKAEGLLSMIRSAGVDAGEPAPQERYQRAGKFFESAGYGKAVSELEPLLKDRNSEYYARAVLKTARSYMRLKQYSRAEELLKEYLKAKDPEREAEALASLALIALRGGNERLLINTEKRLSGNHPDSTQSAQVNIYLGRYFESRDAVKSLDYYGKVLDRFKSTPFADDGLWSSGWMEYRAGRFDDACRTFSSYPSTRPNGAHAPRFLYWSARSAEQAGRTEAARAGYEKLANGFRRTYYGYLAVERLGRMDKGRGFEPRGPEARQDIVTASAGDGGQPADNESLITLEEHYIEAMELLTLGLNSRAASELDILARRYSNDEDAIFEIADLYLRAGDYHRALRVYGERLAAFNKHSERIPRSLPRGGASELQTVNSLLENYPRQAADNFNRTSKGGARDYTAIAFPQGIVELARKKARGLSPDPYMIAAIMREESAFNPEVVSTAGAIGLMQVMPSTGRLVARELGKGPIDPSDLFDPDLNIELGAWYLGHLSGMFNNDLVLTIAGYNAGPNAAVRWAGTLPAETDEFIESIPYPETRRYVKKVLNSYVEFKRLYGSEAPLTALQPSARMEDGHRGTDGSGEGF
ncbi:MAG: transglycosylase SLT domain-containing protein [Deltaproteobacteria bacterium]|nr:transglycosylase SLT domain-containing protein [Deltaproteobacteria bacterium]